MSRPLFRLENTQTGEVLIDNLSSDIFSLFKSEIISDGTSKKVDVSGRAFRLLRLTNSVYCLYAAAFDSDRLKSARLLRSEAEVMFDAAKNVESEIQIIRERADSQTKRLIHNLKSLTAKTIQEIYFIALQDKLMASPKDSLRYLEKEVKKNPRDVAKALLEVLKYQTAQKAEYLAFQKLNGDVGQIKRESHRVHKVLMNVFYLFFNDFTDKGVVVNIQQSDINASFDYDSVHVCVYHLIENAAKYVRPAGNFSVQINKEAANVDIVFDMESLYIEEIEVEKIFLENYSGIHACERKLQGSGIGLHLARQMARINGGNLVLLRGNLLHHTPEYVRNKFTLSLPLAH